MNRSVNRSASRNNRGLSGRSAFALRPLAALAAVAGLASVAAAVDRNWVCGGTNWNSFGCWSPAGLPAPADNVNIGNVAGVQNSVIRLDLNETINDLDITDGMTLDTNGFTLDVNLEIALAGNNVVGANSFPSRLRVDQIVNGPEVTAGLYTLSNGAEIELNGGGLLVQNWMSIGQNSRITGIGTVDFSGNAVSNLRNDGVIAPGAGPMLFRQSGSGTFDIDGTSGGGDLDLTASGAQLTFEGNNLAERFGGTLSMVRGTRLHMDLDNPWGIESAGVVNVFGSGSGDVPRITGSTINFFSGTLNSFGGSVLSVDTGITFNTNAEAVLGAGAVIDFNGQTIINDGLFTLFQGASVEFDGATEVRGGEFVTPNDDPAFGSVKFIGATTWNGTVTIDGFATQIGSALVSGPTTIAGGVLDMDGSDNANWSINSNLILNVDRIDATGNEFNTTMNINTSGRINVNLGDPAAAWRMAGTMNLSGNTLLFGTRIGAGSPFQLTGVLNVTGKHDIASSATIGSVSTVNIGAATSALRFMADSVIGANATFTGVGMLQNGGNGDMTLNSGLNTGGVGLANAGTLRVGSSAGIVSVDRFQTTGNWAVQIGGLAAGNQHDRLVANGAATLGGTLQVDLINGFRPAVGDEFTILNATGGISGAFAPLITTTSGSLTYYWSAIVNAADVVLRLDAVRSSCPADIDDGSGTGNPDGGVTIDDLLYYLEIFEMGLPRADVDDGSGTGVIDGGVGIEDLLYYLQRFEGGC